MGYQRCPQQERGIKMSQDNQPEKLSEPLEEPDEGLDEELQKAVDEVIVFAKSLPEDPDTVRQNSMIEKMDRLSGELEKMPSPEELSAKAEEIIRNMDESFSARLESFQREMYSAIQKISEKQESNDRKLSQTLRENANFQIQVRNGMQHDLDDLKKRVSGEQYIPILKEISEMYVDYIFLLENDMSAEDMKKNLGFMFSQFEDFFEENGAEVCVSKEGSPRKSHCCRVVGKIMTGDPEKHNTVARSRKPGIIKGKTVLQPEYVDIYVYDPAMS